MEVTVENWSVNKIWKNREKINEQPEYQRGEVWSDKKKGLLIDSMLRGIDIPKIYLRELNNGDWLFRRDHATDFGQTVPL